MILIFGGAYQGKLKFALNRYGLSRRDVFFCHETQELPEKTAAILSGLHLWVLYQTRKGADIVTQYQQYQKNWKDKILIFDDISRGIVPIEAEMRRWRDDTGRLMQMLAEDSTEVWQVFCGIPKRMK